MPRIARVVAPGYPHHITQRGNNKQTVFDDKKDRIRYLELIKEHSIKYDLEILSYCLMKNHVHFIVIPKNKESFLTPVEISLLTNFEYSDSQDKMVKVKAIKK